MFKKILKNKRGFTLVELMVTISIIGILSAIVYGSLGDSRKIARDDIRKTDLKNLQLAINLYKAQNGEYPKAGCSTPETDWAGPGPKTRAWFHVCDNYIDGLVPDFISELPRDPNRENESNVGYYYRSNGEDFKILAHASPEINFIKSYTEDFSRCSYYSTKSNWNCNVVTPDNMYAVYSVNAEGW